MCINSIIIGRNYKKYLYNELWNDRIEYNEGLWIYNLLKNSISLSIIIIIILIWNSYRVKIWYNIYILNKIRRFNISSFYNIISYWNLNLIRDLILEIEKGLIEYIENKNIYRLLHFSYFFKYDNSSILILFFCFINFLFFFF